MKQKIIFLIGIIVLSFLGYAFTVEDSNESFAIVELYTSQGCSSCPRADKVLEEIGDVYKDKNVIPLGFHVDYWDRLGWKDTFSKHEFSQRQYAYAERFKSSQVYTPQMIVNGASQFNGGDKSTAFKLINKSITRKKTIEMNGNLKELADELTINFNISKEQYNLYDMNVVLIKNEEKVTIKRGENSNRQITYNNIVIDFKSFKAEKTGKVNLSKPKDYKKDAYTIVLFLQEKNNGAIIGAIKINHS